MEPQESLAVETILRDYAAEIQDLVSSIHTERVRACTHLIVFPNTFLTRLSES